MVRFEKDRYVIDIYTGTNPVEDYLELQKEIAYMFSMTNQENIPSDGFYHLGNLLREMQPELETAKRMLK